VGAARLIVEIGMRSLARRFEEELETHQPSLILASRPVTLDGTPDLFANSAPFRFSMISGFSGFFACHS